jgi:hypothetical protein
LRLRFPDCHPVRGPLCLRVSEAPLLLRRWAIIWSQCRTENRYPLFLALLRAHSLPRSVICISIRPIASRRGTASIADNRVPHGFVNRRPIIHYGFPGLLAASARLARLSVGQSFSRSYQVLKAGTSFGSAIQGCLDRV